MTTYVPAEQQLVVEIFVRVMVADEDAYWARAQAMGATVLAPPSDREYALRDFTILEPDGFGVRFGSRLEEQQPPSSG